MVQAGGDVHDVRKACGDEGLVAPGDDGAIIFERQTMINPSGDSHDV